MAWIELHQEVWDHRKTIALADTLDIDPMLAAAYVLRLWTWALTNASDGRLADVRARAIAIGAGYPGDVHNFVTALVDCGWLDRTENGLVIHDWADYAEKWMDRRRADAERKRRARQNKAEASAGRLQDIGRTSAGNPHVPNLTLPNLTNSNKETNMSPSAPVSVPEDLPFDDLLDEEADETTETEPTPLPVKPSQAAPKPGAEAIARLNALYREHIQPNCRVPADTEVRRLLKTFTPEELERAVYNCRDDPWFMDNNAHRGAAWFFGSAKRMDAYVNGKKRETEHGARQSNNGRDAKQGYSPRDFEGLGTYR